MNYNLNLLDTADEHEHKNSFFSAFRKFITLISGERNMLIIATLTILINSALSLLGPYLIGYTVDTYVVNKNYQGILHFSGILLGLYLIAFVSNYTQMRLMGGIGQRMLYRLRNSVFSKLQELPVDFFNQNKSGDLISRINNDTDKVNQFFSQSLVQFVGGIFTMVGSAIFLLSINWELGLVAMIPAVIVWIFTQFISPWVKKRNKANLKSGGTLSAEIQESLQNFKIIVAFNRRDYFNKRFDEVNTDNYKTSVDAGIANGIFMPVYGFASHLGQLIVLTFGIYLIMSGYFTIGLLISFLSYINNFYNPMRQLAALWATFQVAIAGWDRINQILTMETNLALVPELTTHDTQAHISFSGVSFSYPNGQEVLHNVNFELQRGKTYAFVGPTGGGKTTTASLIARLYDTTKGSVLLHGRDIRSYTPEERAEKIGFILQDPYLFSGTVRDNIAYSNPRYTLGSQQIQTDLQQTGLDTLIARFDEGLDTHIQPTGDGISLGQKQLIAFIRTVLRQPELLILDEATANIDTITEQHLEQILQKLPETTTRVIIAHRLNTIESADEIFFVNSGKLLQAGSLNDAVNLLLHNKRES